MENFRVNRHYCQWTTKILLQDAQTPVLTAEGEKKAILFQENLGLKENLDYDGRISP